MSLISLDQNSRTHSLTSGIKSVANDVYAPLRQGVLDIISPIGNVFAGAFNYGSLQSQNEQLQRTIGQLRAAHNAAPRVAAGIFSDPAASQTV